MARRRALVLAVAVVAVCRMPSAVCAQDTTRTQGVRIGLTYAPGSRPGVFITPVAGAQADSVRGILARDLDYGDAVNVIVPEGGDPPSGVLNYPLFVQLGAAAVVQASVTPSGSLHLAVHDVAAARVLNALDFPLPGPPLGAAWRMALHGAADEVERSITGQRGVAQTRVLFERGGRLWSVSPDGADPEPMPGTEGGLSPAWHPSGRYIAYDLLSDDGHHRIMVRDLVAGTARAFTARATLNITPSFSPDGNTLVFASGDDGTDLYAVNPISSDAPHRITVGRGTSNSSPSFSPDGRRIAFVSGLLGHPEIYITDADGSNADLLTTSGFGDQLYRSDPDWSPDGRRVAFQSQINGVFQITTINVSDRSVQQHTSEARNEEPSWAPDGRHLVFASTRSGVKQLWVLDTESGRTRQLTRGGPARMAAWSPRLSAAR